MVFSVLRPIHRWLGLLLVLPLIVQGVSGAILAVEPFFPPPAIAASHGEPRSAGVIVAAASRAAPDAMRPVRYAPAAQPGQAALVSFTPNAAPRGQGVGIVIDPVSLAVLDVRTGRTVFDWIKALHTNLLIEGSTGRSIVGWTGVGLLTLAIIGVVIWWPAPGRWRSALTLDPRATGYMFHRRLHGALGIWSLLLILATATTGILLAFPQTARSALGLADARPPRPAPGARQAAIQPDDLDRAISLAMAKAPDQRVRMVLLGGATDAIRIFLTPPQREGAASTTTVSVDSAGTRVLSVQETGGLSRAELALRWAHDLHFGQGLGPVWRAVTVLTGIVMPIIAAAGTAMWLHRRRRRAVVLQPGEYA